MKFSCDCKFVYIQDRKVAGIIYVAALVDGSNWDGNNLGCERGWGEAFPDMVGKIKANNCKCSTRCSKFTIKISKISLQLRNHNFHCDIGSVMQYWLLFIYHKGKTFHHYFHLGKV